MADLQTCEHVPIIIGNVYPGKVTTCSKCGKELVFNNPVKGKVNKSKKQRRRDKAQRDEIETRMFGRPLTEAERQKLREKRQMAMQKGKQGVDPALLHAAYIGGESTGPGLLNQEVRNDTGGNNGSSNGPAQGVLAEGVGHD